MKITKLLLIICLMASGAFTAKATHIMGSDMIYRTLGNNKYEVTLNVYRDCDGIPFPINSMNIIYRNLSSGVITQNALLKSINNITPVCDTFTNIPCNPVNTMGTGRGVEKHTFVDTIDLNLAANAFLLTDSMFIVEWTQCCRNVAITTGIFGSFYTSIEIANGVSSNNSPYFYEMPFARLHVNRPFRQNFGGYDVDGDSLAFELVDPLSARNTPMTYSSPWSKDEPFTTFKPTGVASPNPNVNPPVGFHIDQLTGFLTFTPTLLTEVSVVVMEVREYRNGVLISKAKREMQFWVENLDNNIAHMVSASDVLCIGVGDTLNFDIFTDDAADTTFGGTPDSIRVTWDNAFAGPDFTTNGSMFEKGNINWIPTAADARTAPYMFTFSALDNSCPYNLRVQKTIRVYVNQKVLFAPPATFTWEQKGDTSFFTNTTNHPDIVRTEWVVNGSFASLDFDFDSVLALDSQHVIELRVDYDIKNFCGQTIFTGTDTTFQIIEPKSCEAKFVIAVDVDTTNPFRIYLVNTSKGTSLSSKWRFSDGDSVIGTGTHNFKKFGKYEVCLEISNATCSDTYCDSLGMDSLGNLRRQSGFTIIMLDETDLVSTERPETKENINIYPNPFNQWLTLESNTDQKIEKIELMDIMGRVVIAQELESSFETKVNTQYLKSGTYLLRSYLENGNTVVNKVVKH